ncbi:MAG: asparagine--tRNA ligase, partial [Amoebophilaceae bacterium]|nr:asparagine--tRNA ligase [Amoebophilaceae bacterium]
QENLQVVMQPSQLSETLLGQLNTGASVAIDGRILASQGKDQSLELEGYRLTLLGSAPDYPLQPKAHSLEFLREWSHLRFRTSTFGAIFRIRHAISYAIHHFFHQRGFFYLHSPIITTADAEGAGELFRVTNSEDFFKKAAYLTVSGQLAAEAAVMGLGSVYTFGPTFRAENSNTARHLAEFWMIEAEVAFNDLEDNIRLAETFLKYLLDFVLKNCVEDLAWLDKRLLESSKGKNETQPMGLLDRLMFALAHPFTRITYTEAIAILMEALPNKNGTFVYPITTWGVDLQSEHERYLVEQHFKNPVIVTDYPKGIKAFYMRQNEDKKTVAAMDVLFPGVGEIIGGSQREERIDYLMDAMKAISMQTEPLNFYLDTRRFGTVPHSGFGLGLERFILFATGMENIRDVIPFPRTPGHADC